MLDITGLQDYVGFLFCKRGDSKQIMAEKQPKQVKKTKRQVKNPETFRERAIKAGEAGDKPGRTAGLKTAGGKLTAPVAAPFKQAARLKPVQAVGKVLLPAYLRNSWRELKLVTWPTWKQSRQLTFAVLVFAVIFGALIAVVDYGLDKVFRNILLK